MHNFILNGCDTDSIMISKPDGSEFTKEERTQLLIEINETLPEYINFADDGYYKTVLYIKAKNYVMQDEAGKIKYKGSALKSSTLEQGSKDLIEELVRCLLEDRKEDFNKTYNKYIRLLHTISNEVEMKKWCSKKTLSEKVYNSERANETKVLKAIEGAEYSHGDKVWVFFNTAEDLVLVENFNGDYNISKLLEKVYKVVLRFKDVYDISACKNYKLKKNQKDLREILNETNSL